MTSEDTDTRLKSFLTYQGDRSERLGEDSRPFPVIMDVALLLVAGTMLIRNTLVEPSFLAWPLGFIIATYCALIGFRPAHVNHWRTVLLSVAAIVLAMLIPVRIGEHVLISSFLACLGCMALFFARGTLAALAAVAGYVVFVGVMLDIEPYGFSAPGFNAIMLVGLAVVLVAALMLQHHFMMRLEASNRQLRSTSDYLQQSIDGLQYAAAAGSVGIWNFKPDEARWNSNSKFRELLDLPEQEFGDLSTELIKQRLSEQAAGEFIERMERPGDSEFELIDILKQNGTTLPCQIMSKSYTNEDGTFIRRGVLVAMGTPPAADTLATAVTSEI